MTNPSLNLILASTSPRRKELLSYLNIPFEIIAPSFEEYIDPHLPLEQALQEIALGKAKSILPHVKTHSLIIGADTCVVIDQQVLGKPHNFDEAFRMLKLLSGREHTVLTAIALMDSHTGREITDLVRSNVTFKTLHDNEIKAYIHSGEPMDKAGSYALQGMGAIFIDHIHGCYTNIIGLSLSRLDQLLKQFSYSCLP